jgi:hypothetical protein
MVSLGLFCYMSFNLIDTILSCLIGLLGLVVGLSAYIESQGWVLILTSVLVAVLCFLNIVHNISCWYPTNRKT